MSRFHFTSQFCILPLPLPYHVEPCSLRLDGYQTHTATVDPSLMESGSQLDLRISLEAMDTAEHPPPPDDAQRPSRRTTKKRPRSEPKRSPARRDTRVIDPKPTRRAPRIERLDAPSRSGQGQGRPLDRKPKIERLE